MHIVERQVAGRPARQRGDDGSCAIRCLALIGPLAPSVYRKLTLDCRSMPIVLTTLFLLPLYASATSACSPTVIAPNSCLFAVSFCRPAHLHPFRPLVSTAVQQCHLGVMIVVEVISPNMSCRAALGRMLSGAPRPEDL